MKKVYRVWLEVGFNTIAYKNSKWYKPLKKEIIRKVITVNYSEEYILAENFEKAIDIYKEKNTYSMQDDLIETSLSWWEFGRGNYLNTKDLGLEIIIKSYPTTANLDKLRKKLSHQEYFELCRQENYRK